ncbi:hypothetical protein BBJ28_00009045 [Nothophytophthora sp. Chile5]|nr:hypothetical protein BBJ28_00009045 [Nothophytophthora sp. Chile5]
MERAADGPQGRRDAAKGGDGGRARRQLRRRRASDALRGDVTPGEFVRLAAAIDRCAAFNPKRWRAVLDKSAMVLRGNDSVAVEYAGADGVQRGKRVDVRCGVRDTTSRPSSRDEDAKQSAEPTNGSFGYGVFPPLSVSQYLNQPDMVESILRETGVDEGQEVFDDSRFLQSDAEMHEKRQASRDSYDGNSENEDEVIEYGESLTNIAASGEQVTPLVVLPLLTTVSPRTRRGIARLPAPSEADMCEIQNLERLADQPDRSHDFYRALKRTQLQNARHQQVKRLLPAQKPALQALSTSASTLSSSPPKHRKRRHDTQVQKPRGNNTTQIAQLPLRLRGKEDGEDPQLEESERKRMEAEDSRAGLFTQPTCVTASNPPASPVRTHASKHTRDYDLLVRNQQRALSQERAAGIQVKHTIDEIKHWMPLDAIYAAGLGEFASPAQQRATEP